MYNRTFQYHQLEETTTLSSMIVFSIRLTKRDYQSTIPINFYFQGGSEKNRKTREARPTWECMRHMFNPNLWIKKPLDQMEKYKGPS
jgi:hypothetical protein